MAHRTPGVSCKLDGASSCVPLRTAVCANLGVPVLGTIAFPPAVGVYSVPIPAASCLCATASFLLPREGPSPLSLGRSSLERGDDWGLS